MMWLDKENFHNEEIICPNCAHVNQAIVYETYPFYLYAHVCDKCGYAITESEWHKNV